MRQFIFILLFLFVASVAFSQETCKTSESVVLKEKKEDINSQPPKGLEGAEIVIRTKDGIEKILKSEDFKVVKRQQQFKVVERVIVQKIECEPKVVEVREKPTKNMVLLGIKNDYVNLSSKVSGNTAVVYREDGPVLDIGYMRRQVYDSNFGAGVGLDTNSVIRIFGGYEF